MDYALMILALLVMGAVGWFGHAWREALRPHEAAPEPEPVVIEVRCMKCQQPIADGARVCECCGDELPSDAIRQADGVWKCRRCKAVA